MRKVRVKRALTASGLGADVNGAGAAQAGFDCALDPAVGERTVLAGEVDSAFGGDDVGVQQRLLLGLE